MPLQFEFRTSSVFSAGSRYRPLSLPNAAPIQGVTVDNPSGRFLTSNTQPPLIVPPYTLGWSRDVPNISEIQFQTAHSLAGPQTSGATLPTGTQIVITVYSEPVGDSDGYPAGMATSTPTDPFWVLKTNTLIGANEIAQTVTLLAALTSRHYVLGGCTIGPDATAGATSTLRDWIQFLLTGAISGTVFGRGAISVESPHCVLPIMPASAKLQTNEALNLTGTTRAGTGTQLCVADLMYRIEND